MPLKTQKNIIKTLNRKEYSYNGFTATKGIYTNI